MLGNIEGIRQLPTSIIHGSKRRANGKRVVEGKEETTILLGFRNRLQLHIAVPVHTLLGDRRNRRLIRQHASSQAHGVVQGLQVSADGGLLVVETPGPYCHGHALVRRTSYNKDALSYTVFSFLPWSARLPYLGPLLNHGSYTNPQFGGSAGLCLQTIYLHSALSRWFQKPRERR